MRLSWLGGDTGDTPGETKTCNAAGDTSGGKDTEAPVPPEPVLECAATEQVEQEPLPTENVSAEQISEQGLAARLEEQVQESERPLEAPGGSPTPTHSEVEAEAQQERDTPSPTQRVRASDDECGEQLAV